MCIACMYVDRVYTYANRVNARENRKNNRPGSASFCKKIGEKLAPTFTTVLFGSDNTTEERDGWETVLCDARWGCGQR